MRENIGLFKAKDINTNEWREGHLLKAGNIFYIAVERYNENIIFNQKNCDNTFIFYRIDTETLCECTGLKDKNGKLIWENDIVKVDNWQEKQTVYMHKWGRWTLTNYAYELGFLNPHLTCEVVGNKFEEENN